jgi:hypothetical protein
MPSDLFPVLNSLGITAGLAVLSWARAAEVQGVGIKTAYSIAGLMFFYSVLVAVMEAATSKKKTDEKDEAAADDAAPAPTARRSRKY